MGARGEHLGRLAVAAILAGGCDPEPLPSAAELPREGAFTIVVLPDTQGYILNYKWDGAMAAQTRWIAENAGAHDIRYVLHLGDIVNNNRTTQWKLARGLFEALHDGDAVKVPYALVAGNHDIGENGTTDSRWTLMTRDEYFGRGSPYGRQPTIGGFFEPASTLNTWHEFTAGGRKWMILALEFGPRDAVVAWADEVLAAHPDHRVIVITHAYLNSSNGRFQYIPYAGGQNSNPHEYPLALTSDDINDGEELWQKLLSRHANVRLVLSGHVLEDGEGRMTSVGARGQVVHQLVQNYQPGVAGSEFGGQGYLRLMEFWPDGETVRVRTYSPHLGKYLLEPGHEFFLTLHDEPVGRDDAQAVADARPVLYYRPQRAAGSSVMNWVHTRSELDGVYDGDGDGPWVFDGDDAIRPRSPLPRSQAWTVETWVRPQRRGSRQILFTNDRPPSEVEDEEDTGETRLEFHDDVLVGISPEGSEFAEEKVSWSVVHRDESGVRTIAEGPRRVLAGRWYHVVAAADGERLRLYVDGDLASEVEAAGEDLDLAAGPVTIGRSDNIPGAALYGEIGEFAVYDRALSAAEVIEHRMAAFSRVAAARVEVLGTVSEELEGVELAEQGLPGLSVTLANRGDLQVFLGGADARNPTGASTGGTPASTGEGILLATVAENMRTGMVGSASTNWNSWSQGIVGVATTQVGAVEEGIVVDEDETPTIESLYDVEPTVTREVNVDLALAWFPFRGGWRGGHVRVDGALLAGNEVTQEMVHAFPGVAAEEGRVIVDLEVDAMEDGMLFALGADGKNRVAVAGPRVDGPGWEVRLQSNSVARDEVTRPSLAEVLEELEIPADEWKHYTDERLLTWDSFAFVYVPLDASGLVGGVYDGLAEESRLAAGDFVWTRLAAGAYQLEIAGETPQTGMLMLTGADPADERNAALTYEGDEFGAFQVRAWEVETAAPRDTVFAWAFVAYGEAPRLPH